MSDPERSAKIMKSWLRKTYIILTVGGSFTGAVLTLQAFMSSREAIPMVYAMYVGFIGLYSYGTWAGLRFAEKEEDKGHLIIFYWLQVPWLSSPIIGYRFTAGFHISGALIGDRLSGLFRLGSDWQCDLLRSIPWGIGLNVFALIMVVILMKNKKPNQSLEPTTLAGAAHLERSAKI
jgi:hypothetical protein